MAAKTDKKPNNPLPVNTDDLTPSSNITYNNEVVAIIAGLAANEVEGIAGMCTVSGSLMSKNRNVTKGVKVEVGSEEVAVDLYVIVEYGIPIQRAAADAQENVRKAIESMTGLHVVRVDVHVQSVSFEQEKKALQAGAPFERRDRRICPIESSRNGYNNNVGVRFAFNGNRSRHHIPYGSYNGRI